MQPVNRTTTEIARRPYDLNGVKFPDENSSSFCVTLCVSASPLSSACTITSCRPSLHTHGDGSPEVVTDVVVWVTMACLSNGEMEPLRACCPSSSGCLHLNGVTGSSCSSHLVLVLLPRDLHFSSSLMIFSITSSVHPMQRYPLYRLGVSDFVLLPIMWSSETRFHSLLPFCVLLPRDLQYYLVSVYKANLFPYHFGVSNFVLLAIMSSALYMNN